MGLIDCIRNMKACGELIVGFAEYLPEVVRGGKTKNH